MAKPGTRTIGAVALLAAGLAVVLVVVMLAADRWPVRRSGPRGAGEIEVPPQGATWVQAEVPDAVADPKDGLFAGDHGGGAVAYLRFQVPEPPDGAVLSGVELRLTRAGTAWPTLVEVAAVPDTRWAAGELTWRGAPAPGPVVGSVRPEPDADDLSFDLTRVVTGPGYYAFAITVPPGQGRASFVDAALHLTVARATPTPAPTATAAAPHARRSPTAGCVVGEKLVPSCGALWGVAPAGHTDTPRATALTEFERVTGRRQHIYHAYHRGQDLFPTAEEVAIARDGRILFLNWKPELWSWADIAAGRPGVESYLDRLAEHLRATYREPFFFTVHHEPENDVRAQPGSGWEARDYAAMFRHVVEGLRDRGVDNLVTVVAYMAFVDWNVQPWWDELYPGDDVVDWVGWDVYAYSEPGYGFGDFAEMVNRRSARHPDWPGFYNWATARFPDKPLMLAEWGVWHSSERPEHMARFYDSAARQAPLFPRLKALVYFDTPGDQKGRDSRPTVTESGLAAYQDLSDLPHFQVRVATGPG